MDKHLNKAECVYHVHLWCERACMRVFMCYCRVCAFECVGRAQSVPNVLPKALAERILAAGLLCLEDNKFSQVRAAAVALIQALVTKTKGMQCCFFVFCFLYNFLYLYYFVFFGF